MHQQRQIDYRRVERGIAYIAAHFREGPALEDVAAAAHVFDFPTRLCFVDVRVAASDAVKGSHIQRSPLSMGGLCE